MSEKQVAGREVDRELLRKVYDALDLVEIGLDALTRQGKSEAMDLVLQLRQQIIEEFSHVERGAELESNAS